MLFSIDQRSIVVELETKTEFHFSFIADFHLKHKKKKILNNFF